MKKLIETEVAQCDFCHADDEWGSVRPCMECIKDVCYKCAVRYQHSVTCGGTGDGYYCITCDNALTKNGLSPRHKAYRAVKRLIDEQEAYAEDFLRRSREVEAELAKLT